MKTTVSEPRFRQKARIGTRGFAAFTLLAALTFGSTDNAQETRQEFWSEGDLYAKLNDQFKLRFLASLTRAMETAKNTEGTLEIDFDIGVKAFIRERLRNLPDNHRGKYLTLRTGYAYIPSFGEGSD